MILSRNNRFPRKIILLCLVDCLCTALAMVGAVLLRQGWQEGLAYLQLHRAGILISWASSSCNETKSTRATPR